MTRKEMERICTLIGNDKEISEETKESFKELFEDSQEDFNTLINLTGKKMIFSAIVDEDTVKDYLENYKEFQKIDKKNYFAFLKKTVKERIENDETYNFSDVIDLAYETMKRLAETKAEYPYIV